MDKPPSPPKKRFEHLWHAILGGCVAAGYDFQFYKKSKPPVDDPQVVYPDKFKDVVIPDE